VGNGNVALTSTTDMNGSFRFDARSGQGFMDLTGNCDCGAASGVAQTVPTVPGNTYQLTFWVGNAYIPSQGTTSTINVYLGSSLLFSAENIRGASLDHQVWQKFSTAFVASGTSAVLSFINGDPDGDLMNGLDDVQLTETAGAHGFSTLYTFTGGTERRRPVLWHDLWRRNRPRRHDIQFRPCGKSADHLVSVHRPCRRRRAGNETGGRR